MSHAYLHCTRCDAVHAADMATLRCDECASPLEVWYEDESSPDGGPQPPGWTGPPIRLPVHNAGSLISLGEGQTPCAPLPTLAGRLGLRSLHAKLEFLNPTGSFKDRGTAVMMSVAREQGVREVVEDSSGNAGASVAAYAARAGIKAHVFVPASAPVAKVGQIRVYGAEAHPIEGPREATTEAAVAYSADRGIVYASHNLSPYFIEGTRTLSYEIAQQFAEGMPDHVVMPVGNGSLFIGAWKGLEELRDAGTVGSLPRLHCVQAEAVQPIVAAYRGEAWAPTAGVGTVAGGIAAADPPRKHQILEVLAASGGVALAVGDDEILEWQRLLAGAEGIYAEPTSAAAFAGLVHLVTNGDVKPSDSVLIPVTGFGLKDVPPV